MRFSALSFITLAASASLASAGTFISPAAGSTISSSSFNFTWQSSRYFKETSLSISVLLSQNFTGTYDSIELVNDLAPVAGTDTPGPQYTAELDPQFFYGDAGEGTHQLVVVERYIAYGGKNAESVEWQDVVFGS